LFTTAFIVTKIGFKYRELVDGVILYECKELQTSSECLWSKTRWWDKKNTTSSDSNGRQILIQNGFDNKTWELLELKHQTEVSPTCLIFLLNYLNRHLRGSFFDQFEFLLLF